MLLGDIIDESFDILYKENIDPFTISPTKYYDLLSQKPNIKNSCAIDHNIIYQSLENYKTAIHNECKFNNWLMEYTQNIKMDSGIAKNKVNELEQVFINNAKKYPYELEKLLTGKKSGIESMLTKILAQHSNFQLSERTIFLYERYLEENHALIIHKDNSKHIALILTENAIKYSASFMHTTFLSNAIVKDYFPPETKLHIINEFILNVDSEINFDWQVFKNFELLLPNSNNQKDLTLFIAYGAKKITLYIPEFHSLQYFEKYIENTEHQEILLSAIAKILESKLSCSALSDADLNFIQNKINYYLDIDCFFPATLVDKLIDIYIKTQAYFSDILIQIIESYYNIYSYSLKNLTNQLIDVLNTLEATEKAKDIIFMLSRLVDVNAVKHPDKVLSSIARFLNSNDPYLKRVAIKLSAKLGVVVDGATNSYADFQSLTNSFNSSIYLIKSLERISNYNISSGLIDRNGYTISDVLLKTLPEAWNAGIKRIYDDNIFFVEYSAEDLIKEIELHNDNDRILELIENNYFNQTLRAINAAENDLRYKIEFTYEKKPQEIKSNIIYVYSQDNQILFSINKQIHYFINDESGAFIRIENILRFQQPFHKQDLSNIYSFLDNKYADIESWTRQDFIVWKNSIQQVDDNNIAKVIAVLKQVAYKTIFHKKHYPRDAQILAILSMFKSETGRLVQVHTGEGKSVEIAIFASLKVLNGHHVDVITSSKELAIRDSKDQSEFYQLLNVTISHNIGGSSDKVKECYQSDIRYGDAFHHAGDVLRDVEYGTRGGIGFDTIIVDEVDNLFIDLNAMMVKLSLPTSGFYNLKQLLVYMWSMHKNVLNFGLDKCHPENPESSIEKCDKFIREEINEFMRANFLDDAIINDKRPISIPNHLNRFTKEHLDKWINSLMLAMFGLGEDVDYAVKGYFTGNLSNNTADHIRRVSPIDYKITGTINSNMHWGDGLHQLLSLKHNTPLANENLVSIFMTYREFFTKYKGSIYGLTGTLGGEPHKNFMKKFYGVDFVSIPTFKQKKLAIFPEIITTTKAEWTSEIIRVTKARAIDDSRAVLIIMESIEQVEKLYEILKDEKDLNLFKYTHGTEHERSQIEKNKISKYTVIIATNLAGRGSDIKISTEVERNGGLHVILTFFPDSIRVLNQAFGRAARKGEHGSAQVILFETKCKDITCLNEKRDKNEVIKFQQEKICKLPGLQIQDWLFSKFQALMMKIDSPTGYNIGISKEGIVKQINNNQIYIYYNNTGIYLAGNRPNNIFVETRIDEVLANLNSVLAKHISVIVRSNNKTGGLNRQDANLIHYIAARNGLISPSYSVLINVNKELDIYYNYGLWQQYLKTYNHNSENRQLKAHWEMWYYQQRSLLDNFIKECNYADEEGAVILEELLKAKLSASFEAFAVDIESKYHSIDLFNNPSYIIEKSFYYKDLGYSNGVNHLGKAIEYANKAINLDDKLAWPAYQALVIMTLIKSAGEIKTQEQINDAIGIKNQAAKYLYEALTRLEHTIEQTDGAIANLAISGLLAPDKELMAKYAIQRVIFIKFKDSINNAIEVIKNCPADHGVKVDRSLDTYELIKNANVTEAVQQMMDVLPTQNSLMNTTSLSNNIALTSNSFIETDAANEIVAFNFVPVVLVTYQLDEVEQDWTGTIFSALLGAIQIFAGFSVIALGGPFATSFGLSMLMSGIGDIVFSAISVIEGTAIDLNGYFKSKALTYAIAVTTAGIMQMAGKTIMVAKEGTEKVALNTLTRPEIFAYAATLQAANMIIGTIAGYAAKQYVDRNAGDANAESQSAANWLINNYQSQLQIIFAADAINKNTNLLNNLESDANYVAMQCSKRFHDIPTAVSQAAVSTTVGLGGNFLATAAASAAASTVLGIIKYSEFTGEFKDEYAPYITATANTAQNTVKTSTAQLMQIRLSQKFDSEAADPHLIQSLYEDGFVDSGNNINYANCAKITSYNQTLYPENLTAIKSVCDEIYYEYTSYLNNLRSYLQSVMYKGMTSTLQNDIAIPMINQVGHVIYDLTPNLVKQLKDKKAKTEENTQEAAKIKLTKNKAEAEVHEEAPAKSSKLAKESAQNIKGKIVYDEPIGPREPFADYVNKHLEQFNRMPISAEDKQYAYDHLYDACRDFEKLPIEEQKAFVKGYPATDDPIIDNINILKSMVNYLDKKAEQAQNYQDMRDGIGRTLNRDYAFGQSFDQYYVVAKGMVKATFTEGKYAFKEAAPNLYEKLADGLSSIAKSVSNNIKQIDSNLESSKFAKEYNTGKEFAGVVVDGVCENAPEWGQDLLLFAAGEGIGGAVVSGAKTAVKSSSHLLRKSVASKLDDIYIGDIRLEPTVSQTTKKFFQNIPIHTRVESSVFNEQIAKWYPRPPFRHITKVGIFDVDHRFKQFEFVHMYNQAIKGEKIVGQFFALKNDVKGLTSQQMKDIWDLPYLPTHISDVNPPSGTKVAVGIVQEGNFGGKGKATQYFFVSRAERDYFSKGVSIDEFNKK